MFGGTFADDVVFRTYASGLPAAYADRSEVRIMAVMSSR
jgi:hypothetical protein